MGDIDILNTYFAEQLYNKGFDDQDVIDIYEVMCEVCMHCLDAPIDHKEACGGENEIYV